NPPFLVFFSFYQYGAHRDLPSFPTRRSSDLEVVINPVANVAGIADDRAGYTFEVFRYFGLFDKGPLEQVIIRSIGKIFHLFARQDRKSTRLNSSHVKISYAVFCLKKKNQSH